MSEYIVVQNSKYWNSWRASKVYSLQVNIYSGNIECEPSSAIRPSQIDPYVVCFLARDRSLSKKKTTILKKTVRPVWNECVLFTGLDIQDKFCIELKMPAWGPINPVLAHYAFTLEELLVFSADDLECKTFKFTSGTPGVSADVTLGFVLDAPVSCLQVPDLQAEGAHANQILGENASGELPVFLNTHGAFASFSFYADSHQYVEEYGQVVPHDSTVKSQPSNVVAL